MKPFPQGGTLTYTWARRGQQPQGKTSGKRKGYKVFGWIDSFTGRLFYQGQEGRLNATTGDGLMSHVRMHAGESDGPPYHER
jgi:hypothetical protein